MSRPGATLPPSARPASPSRAVRRHVGPIAVIGSGPVAGVVLRELRARGLGTVEPDVNGHSSCTWLDGCDVCVLCPDTVDAAMLLDVNARCLESGVPLVPGIPMGVVGQAGPVVRGGSSPCLQCVDLRLRTATGRSCLYAYGEVVAHVAERLGQDLAERAARVMAGTEAPQDGRLRYHWADGSTSEHPVLRTAHCPQCAGLAAQLAPRAVPRRQLDNHPGDPLSILRLERELVDPVTGPIQTLVRLGPEAGDPAIATWLAPVADPGWAQAGHPILSCGGTSLDDDQARAAALGEAVERMSACAPRATAMPVAPYDDVVAHAVDPAAWDLFDPATREQAAFPFARVSPADPISWTWGSSLTRQRPVLVPASRVFLAFGERTPADRADHPVVSGFATGNTHAEAATAALLETIERDALMIAWVNRLSPPRLALDRSSPGPVGAYAAAFEDAGVELRCLLLALDLGAPVVVAMARGARPRDRSLVLAAAAGLDPASACVRALAELAANRRHVRHMAALASAHREAVPVPRHERRGADDPPSAGAAQLEDWWDARETVSIGDVHAPIPAAAALHRLVCSIAAAGLETVIVDLTLPEIRDLGVCVAKAIVPGSYPLMLDDRWPHLGGPRLRWAPVRSGLLGTPRPSHELNRLPLPFPSTLHNPPSVGSG